MRTLVVGLTMGLVVTAAGATEIWATSSNGLIRFDSATPQSVVVVGDTGVTMMQGMDFRSDGVMFGITDDDLYTLNLTTGHATLVGPCNWAGSDVPLDLSWDPTTRQMYAVAGIDTDSPMHLYTLNLSTGAATLVGTLDLPAPSLPAGLATNAAGVRYVHDGSHSGMYRLEGLHGVFMGLEGVPGGLFEGMTIDWSGTGTWYHALWNTGMTRSELWTVDESTGVGTFVGLIGADEHLLIGDIAVLPEPATVLVMVLALLTVRRR